MSDKVPYLGQQRAAKGGQLHTWERSVILGESDYCDEAVTAALTELRAKVDDLDSNGYAPDGWCGPEADAIPRGSETVCRLEVLHLIDEALPKP